jgi:DNA-binding CsgD family transcriptional regulator
VKFPDNLKNNERSTETGFPGVGHVPWGSHFCTFFETEKDLLDILTRFFKTGLERNEYCLWVVGGTELATIKRAREELGQCVATGRNRLGKGHLEIITHKQLFGLHGRFDAAAAVARVGKKAAGALKNGFSGLRWNGSPTWVRLNLKARRYREFEREIDTLLEGQRMIAVCTFPLALTGAPEILDAARTHHFTVTVRDGAWKRVEIGDVDAAMQEADPDLEHLTFRQRQILQHIAEGLNTKRIAALLEISIKTVECHRLRLMGRLKIDNVPGLVRFAIRSGLISSAA